MPRIADALCFRQNLSATSGEGDIIGICQRKEKEVLVEGGDCRERGKDRQIEGRS